MLVYRSSQKIMLDAQVFIQFQFVPHRKHSPSKLQNIDSYSDKSDNQNQDGPAVPS
jgi:hypothetical protein